MFFISCGISVRHSAHYYMLSEIEPSNMVHVDINPIIYSDEMLRFSRNNHINRPTKALVFTMRLVALNSDSGIRSMQHLQQSPSSNKHPTFPFFIYSDLMSSQRMSDISRQHRMRCVGCHHDDKRHSRLSNRRI